ncbi:hypothetical protein CHS0354_009072 [Potamilus streckersoni]|uniref:Uncharacterized protein n=1 Tax=Potamilus streckersoni TaxID=2493646 RepID=A0AAE0THR6_9BIVA|nr:hypothetical protein CHS0354_009072 [Potamilus streckersoni]
MNIMSGEISIIGIMAISSGEESITCLTMDSSQWACTPPFPLLHAVVQKILKRLEFTFSLVIQNENTNTTRRVKWEIHQHVVPWKSLRERQHHHCHFCLLLFKQV